MKLLSLLLLGAQSSKTLKKIRKKYGEVETCGKLNVEEKIEIHRDIELDKNESLCAFRIMTRETVMIEHFTLELDCDDGEVYFVNSEEEKGPFCNEKRKRRNPYGNGLAKVWLTCRRILLILLQFLS